MATPGLLSLLLTVGVSPQLVWLLMFRVLPEKGPVWGVFQLSTSPAAYALNASGAQDACHSHGAKLATQLQVEQANGHGLETCRFGWIEERVAVISRISPKPGCGQNKTGIMYWRTNLSYVFDAFCFIQEDVEEDLSATNSIVITSSASSLHSSNPISASSTSPSFTQSDSLSVSVFPISGDGDSYSSHAGIVSLITVSMLLLLAAAAVFWCCRREGNAFQLWKTKQEPENIETKQMPQGKQDPTRSRENSQLDSNSNHVSLCVASSEALGQGSPAQGAELNACK